ncbi:MAG: FHA domain-containing protein [Sporichthyaceae bacterium]
MSRLFVTASGITREFEPGTVVVIGRDLRCSVVLADTRVGDQQLSIHHDPARGAWVAADSGSGGGTFSSGEQLTRFAIERPVNLMLGDPATGEQVVVGPVPVAPAPEATVLSPWQNPGAEPGYPSGPQGPPPGPQTYPPGPQLYPPGPQARPAAHQSFVLGTILMIVGFVAAGLGVLGSFLAFPVYDDGPAKVAVFLTELSLTVGLGAAAVAAGMYLRGEARR